MGLAENISDQIRTDTSHHFNYPPGQKLSLGDIVIRDGGTWTVIGNLAERAGITIQPIVSDVTDGVFQPTSSRGYDISIKAEGKLDPAFPNIDPAKAGAKITLAGDHAFALSMKEPSFKRIPDVDEFWEQVKANGAINTWTWDLGRRIVTSVVECKQVLFVSSASGESSFELEASGTVSAGAAVSLLDLAGGFSLKSTMEGSDLFAGKQATPLFKAYRVKLFGIGAAALEGQKPIEDTTLEEEL